MDEKCIMLLCIIHIHRISELSVHVDTYLRVYGPLHIFSAPQSLETGS